MNNSEQIREIALKWAVKSYTDLEQPRANARGYTSGNNYRSSATTDEIVTRAKAFETFIDGTNTPKEK